MPGPYVRSPGLRTGPQHTLMPSTQALYTTACQQQHTLLGILVVYMALLGSGAHMLVALAGATQYQVLYPAVALPAGMLVELCRIELPEGLSKPVR